MLEYEKCGATLRGTANRWPVESTGASTFRFGKCIYSSKCGWPHSPFAADPTSPWVNRQSWFNRMLQRSIGSLPYFYQGCMSLFSAAAPKSPARAFLLLDFRLLRRAIPLHEQIRVRLFRSHLTSSVGYPVDRNLNLES